MNVRERLQGGDPRQPGNADAVASDVLRYPDRFGDLFEAMLDEDPVVRTRAADALEKVTRGRPDLLVPFRKRLLDEAGAIDQPAVRRAVAQLLPRVKYEPKERRKAIDLLERSLDASSANVVAAAMQALSYFSNDDAVLRERMVVRLERLSKSEHPLVAERARRLFARLSSQQRRRRA